jgi:hypothetical protein
VSSESRILTIAVKKSTKQRRFLAAGPLFSFSRETENFGIWAIDQGVRRRRTSYTTQLRQYSKGARTRAFSTKEEMKKNESEERVDARPPNPFSG